MNKRGFTLIELLTVVTIIGILAGLISISFLSSREKSRDARRKADLRNIYDAASMYAISNQNKYYVNQSSSLAAGYSGNYYALCISGSDGEEKNYNKLKTAYTPYLSEGIFPVDPTGKCVGTGSSPQLADSKTQYLIIIDSTLRKMSVWAGLENNSDPDRNDTLTGGLYTDYLGYDFLDNSGDVDRLYAVGSPK